MTLLSTVARTTVITAIVKTESGKACGRITFLVSAFFILRRDASVCILAF
jgi:hypothetical protein